MPVGRLLAYLGYDMGTPIVGRTEAVNTPAMRRLVEPRKQQPAASPRPTRPKPDDRPRPRAEPSPSRRAQGRRASQVSRLGPSSSCPLANARPLGSRDDSGGPSSLRTDRDCTSLTGSSIGGTPPVGRPDVAASGPHQAVVIDLLDRVGGPAGHPGHGEDRRVEAGPAAPCSDRAGRSASRRWAAAASGRSRPARSARRSSPIVSSSTSRASSRQYVLRIAARGSPCLYTRWPNPMIRSWRASACVDPAPRRSRASPRSPAPSRPPRWPRRGAGP